MDMKIIITTLALACGLPLSAFTVEDLVVDNGIYAIENLYWSKADQYISLYTGECEYENPPLGASKGLHFEYVKDLNGNILPKFVKLVGFRGFTGATSYVDRDFIFTIADDDNNAVEDGTRLILPNDDSWGSNYAGMIYLNFESCVSTDGSYMLGAIYGIDPKWYLEQFDFIPYLYRYGKKNTYSSPTITELVGEMSLNAEGNVVVEFDNPSIFWKTGYRGTSGYGAGCYIDQQNGWNITQPLIIEHFTIETFRPDGFLKVTEYLATTSGYSTKGTTTTVPYKMEVAPDGTFSIVNMIGKGYTRSFDEIDRVVPGTFTGRIDGGAMILTGGQNMDVRHTALSDLGGRTNNFSQRVARLTDFPNRNFEFEDVVGTATGESTITHTSNTNFWVKPGSCRTVIRGASMKIGPFAGVFHTVASYGELYHSTSAYTVETDGGAETDCTLDLEITSCKGSNKGNVKNVECVFQVNKNDAYVESYDLMMVPHFLVDGSPETHENFTAESGHTEAVYVGSVAAADFTAPAVGSYPREYTVAGTVDLSGIKVDPKNEYYFFIRANYRSEISLSFAEASSLSARAASLHPTFHDFFILYDPTAIDSVEADEASDAPVEYFDLCGRRVENPQAGIYIRRRGATVERVKIP